MVDGYKTAYLLLYIIVRLYNSRLRVGYLYLLFIHCVAIYKKHIVATIFMNLQVATKMKPSEKRISLELMVEMFD